MARRIAERPARRYARLDFRLRALTLVLCAMGCDRPDASAEAASDTSAATDTVVRRVIRVPRVPTLMQRATGAVGAFHALRPLDSAFAIRVMDQRGIELPGVTVSWTLQGAGDGASLRVLNARTDSLGLSRVVFTPGRTALSQTVLAEVDRVGQIPFRIDIPAASIRVIADEPTMWSEDKAKVRAELRDLGNVALVGGSLGWGSSDSSVVAIESVDGTQATVHGRRAGTADITAWAEPGHVRGTVRVRVRPTISGLFLTLDGGPVPRVNLEARLGARRDAVLVQDGRFTARLDLASYTEVELHAVPESPAHHEVHTRVESPRALQDLRIVLIPTQWHIEHGTYAGREIAIDARAALRRAVRGGGFWRLPPVRRNMPPVIIGWPPEAYPIRIVFDRRRTRNAISAADSAAFWRIAEQMEADLGGRFFIPAQMSGDSTMPGDVSVEISSAVQAGHTFVTWNGAGEVYDGTLMFRNTATLRQPHVVTHELLHLLGFGHGESFRTVSLPVGGTEQRLTPEDVAYVQLALRLRAFQVRTGARPGLPAIGDW